MTRLMYDALQASGIPSGVDIACWYPYDPRSDGPPKGAKQVLTIDNSVDASHLDCDILDVEPGACFTHAAVAAWLSAKIDTLNRGTLYYDLANREMVVGWIGDTHQWWAADWTGAAQDIVPGSVAMQFKNAGPYDLSLVVDDNWYPVTVTTGKPAWAAPTNIHATYYPPKVVTGFADIAWFDTAGSGHDYHVQLLKGEVSVEDSIVQSGHYTTPELEVNTDYQFRVAVDEDSTHDASPWTEYLINIRL